MDDVLKAEDLREIVRKLNTTDSNSKVYRWRMSENIIPDTMEYYGVSFEEAVLMIEEKLGTKITFEDA